MLDFAHVYKKLWKTGAGKVEKLESHCVSVLKDCTRISLLSFVLRAWIKQIIVVNQDHTFFCGGSQAPWL